MNTGYTYSRAELQGMPEKRKKEFMQSIINHSISHSVVQAAQIGKTQYFHNTQITGPTARSYPPPPTFTNEEFVEALKEKFPDTTVEYQETWIETRPGVKEQKKGFLIDWS